LYDDDNNTRIDIHGGGGDEKNSTNTNTLHSISGVIQSAWSPRRRSVYLGVLSLEAEWVLSEWVLSYAIVLVYCMQWYKKGWLMCEKNSQSSLSQTTACMYV
jgi:hypothetical protein